MSESELHGSEARVLLSRGQRKKTDEVLTARYIAGRLRELGFDSAQCWIAATRPKDLTSCTDITGQP